MSRITISVQDVDRKMRFICTIVSFSSQNTKKDKRELHNYVNEDKNDENNDYNMIIVPV